MENSFSAEYMAHFVKKCSDRNAFLHYVSNKESEFLTVEEAEVICLLFSAEAIKSSKSLFYNIFTRFAFNLDTVMVFKNHGLSVEWLKDTLLKAKNFKCLAVSYLSANLVKEGKYLDEIFKYAEDEVEYYADNSIDAEDFDEFLKVELNEDDVISISSPIDIFYKYQKSFLLKKKYLEPFLDDGNFQPLISKGYYQEVIDAGNSEGLELVYEAGQMDLILQTFKRSMLYYFSEKEYNDFLISKDSRFLFEYLEQSKQAQTSGSFVDEPEWLLPFYIIEAISEFLIEKGALWSE